VLGSVVSVVCALVSLGCTPTAPSVEEPKDARIGEDYRSSIACPRLLKWLEGQRGSICLIFQARFFSG